MKRIKFFVIALVIAIFSVFTSCTENEKIPTGGSLVNEGIWNPEGNGIIWYEDLLELDYSKASDSTVFVVNNHEKSDLDFDSAVIYFDEEITKIWVAYTQRDWDPKEKKTIYTKKKFWVTSFEKPSEHTTAPTWIALNQKVREVLSPPQLYVVDGGRNRKFPILDSD